MDVHSMKVVENSPSFCSVWQKKWGGEKRKKRKNECFVGKSEPESRESR